MSNDNNGSDAERVSINRRDLMRTGAAAGAAATVGTTGMRSMTGTVSAASTPSLLGITPQEAAASSLAAIISPVGGAAWLLKSAFDAKTGSGSNEQAKEKWSRMYTQGKEIGAKDEIVNTIINNSYDEFRNPYFMAGKKAAIQSMNNGDSKSTVKSTAVDSADAEHAAPVQENLLKYLDVRNQELIRFSKAGTYIKNNYTESQVNQLFAITADGTVNGGFSKNLTSIATDSEMSDTNFTLFDGSLYTMTAVYKQVDSYGNVFLSTAPFDRTMTYNTNKGTIPDKTDPYSVGDYETTDRDEYIDKIYVYDIPSSDNGNALLFDIGKWHRSYWRLGKYRNQAASELKTWIDGIYSKYTAGDITETQLLNAYDLSDLSTDGSYAAGTVSLYKLGISTDPNTEMTVKLNDGTELVGSLFINDDVTLNVGQIYSPSEFSGSVYMTFVPENSGAPGVREIEQKFKITKAINSSGKSLDKVAFNGSNDVETSNTDVQKLKDELSKLRKRNEKLQQQVESVEGSGGGDGNGLLDALTQTNPWLLLGGAVGGLLLINTVTN